jgi:Cu+-exporting ATPase
MAKDPICGMVVEERKESLHQNIDGTTFYFCSGNCKNKFTEPERELNRLKKLLLIGSLLTLPIVFLTYSTLFPMQLNHYILFALATPVQFWIGLRFYKGSIDGIKSKTANMDVLIAVGTTAAWLYSTVITFVPDFFPFEHVYFETSAVIIMIILTGNMLEEKSEKRARNAVRKLLDLQPRTAHVMRDGMEIEVPVEEINLEEIIIVQPGEKIPTDGIIVDGYSQVDQSAITGESVPVSKSVGDETIGATINKNGVLTIQATKVGRDTVLSQIIQLVKDAKTSKVPFQRLVDKVSSYFVPVIVTVAVGSGLSWFFIGGIDLSFSILAFVSVIVIACPCAIGIATPMALLMGASKAAENGILIKDGKILEIARKTKTIVFDKTGTLTVGRPSVTDVIKFGKFSEDEVIKFASIAEKNSEHPLSKAILNFAINRDIKIDDPDNFESVSGEGVKAEYNNHAILLGNRKILRDSGIDIKHAEQKMIDFEKQGKTTVLLAIDDRICGIIAMADTIKEDALDTISQLKKSGFNIVMLTGDNENVAKNVAEKLGINKVFSEILPAKKENIIRRIKQEGKIVAMVGDGINDAPALATSDVGIAIGSGTDVAKETGDIILIGSNLKNVRIIFEISQKTATKIKQNLAWAFGYNAALVPVAAGVLVPFFGPEMYNFLPFLAAGAMAVSDATVVGNSLLLGRYKPKI